MEEGAHDTTTTRLRLMGAFTNSGGGPAKGRSIKMAHNLIGQKVTPPIFVLGVSSEYRSLGAPPRLAFQARIFHNPEGVNAEKGGFRKISSRYFFRRVGRCSHPLGLTISSFYEHSRKISYQQQQLGKTWCSYNKSGSHSDEQCDHQRNGGRNSPAVSKSTSEKTFVADSNVNGVWW